jgi:two-component system phosphate regulon sensor histidine kinase PhoR
MHPLRLLLLVSLVIAVAVAWGFALALELAGADRVAEITLAVVVFVAFLIPWTAVSLWALRHARDIDALTDRARAIADGKTDVRNSHIRELDELARAIEEMRAMIVRQQKAHEEHRAAMDEIVQSLGEGIIGVSATGRVAVANRRIAEIFGAGEQLVGRSFLEIVRKQSVVAALDKALRGHTSVDRVGIDERQYEVRVFPVAASPEIAAVALFIDITTIEHLQRIRKDFLDDFSHEVRTPLAGLRSAVDTLDAGGLSKADETQLRHVLSRQLVRIERLVKDLSELNQIESGELVLQRRPLDLRSALSEIAEDFGVAVEGESIGISADPARVQQIFANLFDNARKHGGGEVRVTIDAENGEAVVRVTDRGSGIPQGEQERIFHRFYRVDKSRSQQVPGTGLGLAIAKHLVVLHGGSIRAYNAAGGGATFEVRFPV